MYITPITPADPDFIFTGLVQGMVTGMRGLCNGLGPAMFGVIFYIFHVDLNYDPPRYDNNTAGQHMDVAPQVCKHIFLAFDLAHQKYRKIVQFNNELA